MTTAIHSRPAPALLPVHLALLATTAAWGLNLTVVRLLTQTMDLLLVSSLRMVVAAATLWVLLRAFGMQWPRWRGRTLLLGVVMAVFMVYVNQVLMVEGLARTTASNGALCLALGPFASVALERVFFGRRLTLRAVLAIALALAGVSAVVLHRPGAQWQGVAVGDLYVVASAVTFAIGGVVLQRLARHTPPLTVSLFAHAVGAVLLCLHTAAFGDVAWSQVLPTDLRSWMLVLYSGAVASAIGAVAWGRGIAALGIGQTSAYLSWVPIFGTLFGVVLLGEPLTWWHAAGLAAIVGATALNYRGGRSAPSAAASASGPA